MKRKQMTPAQGSEMGLRQMENMIAGLLIDKFDMNINEINKIGDYLYQLSCEVNDKKKQTEVIDWAYEHDLHVHFKENLSFIPMEMRLSVDYKIKAKTTTAIFVMYVLKRDLKWSYDDLRKLQWYVVDLQDSIDKKYLTYEDIMQEQKERGYILWHKRTEECG